MTIVHILLVAVGLMAAMVLGYAVLSGPSPAKESARRTKDPEAGSVRLGLFPTLGPYLLPHVIPQIRARFPRLELLLVEEKTEVILRQLREGKLDAGILALPLHDDSLHQETLFDEAAA